MNKKYKLNKEWLDLMLENKNNTNLTFNLSDNDTRILLTYIEVLQQENKQLKEQLLATQTNEETFRLEMEDITRILGLDEDIIFDDVKTYARSLKENKILRENAEHNDKVVDKVNWENMLLKKENQELKKQLEENKDKINWYENFEINKTIDKLRIKHNNQQKEFIEYMNKTIEELECDDVDDEEMKGYLIQRIDTFKEILSKFKKIIGSDINVGSKGGKDE